ncbi:hypothetical protein GOODEAATRI_026623 [Goodea atripinnis]|uniref:Uncharacterized protein n=1 Tax=Goodea atripinnis TaxID=208336 RepID=A0ABV0NDX5_9TELE
MCVMARRDPQHKIPPPGKKNTPSNNLLVSFDPILLQVFVQLNGGCAFCFHAVGAERRGAGRGATGGSITGYRTEATVLPGCRGPALQRTGGEGSFYGGFKTLLQDWGEPKM